MNKPSEPLPDAWVLGAYGRLERSRPPDHVNHAILARAFEAARDQHRRSPAWVWPLSAAAALVLCVGLFVHVANLIPQPRVIIMPPAPVPAERQEPPAVGTQSVVEPGAAQTLHDARTATGIEVPTEAQKTQERARDDRATELRQRLQQAMENDDVEAFRDVLSALRAEGIEPAANPAVRDWALQHGLEDLIN